jgi:hypothetical protein
VSNIEHTPPRWAEALLGRLIHVRERDSIVGDLRGSQGRDCSWERSSC